MLLDRVSVKCCKEASLRLAQPATKRGAGQPHHVHTRNVQKANPAAAAAAAPLFRRRSRYSPLAAWMGHLQPKFLTNGHR